LSFATTSWSGAVYPYRSQWRAFADVTGDGKADLVTWDGAGYGIYVIPSNGTGFDLNQRWSGAASAAFDATSRALGDVTGDGKADLFSWDATHGVYVVPAASGGFLGTTWSSGTAFPFNQNWMTLADVNGDGKQDLVVWDNNSASGGYFIPSTGAGFDINQRF